MELRYSTSVFFILYILIVSKQKREQKDTLEIIILKSLNLEFCVCVSYERIEKRVAMIENTVYLIYVIVLCKYIYICINLSLIMYPINRIHPDVHVCLKSS